MDSPMLSDQMIDILDKTYDIFKEVINNKIKKDLVDDFKKVLPDIEEKINWSKGIIYTNTGRRLKEYGLYGREFNLKKKIFDQLYKYWIHDPDNIRKLKKLLYCINSILGSMALVFSPLHAVKEYKEMIELAIDKTDN